MTVQQIIRRRVYTHPIQSEHRRACRELRSGTSLCGRTCPTGNITASGVTNDIGRASATLNYTISTLGYLNVIWAQGESVDAFTGGAKRVTDAEIGSYPGLAPATIVASPSPILGNTTQQVQVCLFDAMLAPLQRVRLGFSFQLGQGTGSVDGVSGAGLLGSSTGANGCVIANVVTSGLVQVRWGASAC